MTAAVTALQTLADIHRSDVVTLDFAGDCVLVTGSGDKKVRVWRWRPTRGYVQASFSPLTGHKYGVTSVKVSPRSTMLATASIDGTTLLWNLRTGAKIHAMVQVGGEAVRVSKFSPDSTLLATAGDNGQVCLWDLVRRDLIGCFRKHDGSVRTLSFSPDSAWFVTACTFGVLKLFSVADVVDYSPSSSSSSTTATASSIVEFASVDDAHDLGVLSSDFSPSRDVSTDEPFAKSYLLVTCGNDRCVKLWRVAITPTKNKVLPLAAEITVCRIMEKHGSSLTCVRFNSSGSYFASSGLDKTTVVWETNTGKIMSVTSGHRRYVACCAFSRDGNLLATGSNDKSVIVWDLTGNLSLDSELGRRFLPPLQAPPPPPSPLRDCFDPDSRRRRSTDYEQRVVNNAEASSSTDVRLVQRLAEGFGVVNSVAVYGNRLVASGSGDKMVRVWCIGSVEPSDRRKTENQDENDDGDDRDNNHDSDSDFGFTFQEMPYSPLDGHKYSVNYVEFSPCGTMLASCSLDGTVAVWNTENGRRARSSFFNSGSSVRVCRWSPDGTKIATAGDDESTTLWDVESMEELCVFRGHSDAVNAIAFSHDSRYLVTACSEGTWRFFDTVAVDSPTNCALTVCEEAHDLGVQGCDFSPTSVPLFGGRLDATRTDERSYLLATGGNDSFVKLWRITISKENEIATTAAGTAANNDSNVRFEARKTLPGHGGNVTCVRFSPSRGEILGSVATDRTARIWSVYSGACLYVLEEHESLVTSCAFSEDTSLFITGALDKSVLIWRIPRRLISQNVLVDDLRHDAKKVADWRVDDTLTWLNETGLAILAKRAYAVCLVGQRLLAASEDELIRELRVQDEETMEAFKTQLYWLKREDSDPVDNPVDDVQVPDQFVCPITHEIMKDPVLCSDGFTYERAAINEWFLCGKFTSPMTNECLQDTSFATNIDLRNAIRAFLHGDRPSSDS